MDLSQPEPPRESAAGENLAAAAKTSWKLRVTVKPAEYALRVPISPSSTIDELSSEIVHRLVKPGGKR
eukprot:SAG31_NODE_208_length_20313_cov_6.143119_10_plen_68_part_00